MRRPRFRLIVALLTLLTCGGAAHAFAQEAAADPQAPQSPLDLLLDQGQTLDLSAAQLDQLDGIRKRLAGRNDPLVQQMLTLRKEWQQERRAGRGEGRPRAQRLQRIRNNAERIRARIQRNNQTAMQSVNRLLTPPQRAQLRAIIQERRRQAPPGGRGSRDGDDGP
jgi:Spy/CpxP family protein refolding chaperone